MKTVLLAGTLAIFARHAVAQGIGMKEQNGIRFAYDGADVEVAVFPADKASA